MEDKVNTGNAVVDTAESNSVPAKKSSRSKNKVNQQKKSQPPTSEMVTAAIKELKDRKGSSLQAIKKYIVTTYKMDAEKVAPFIKRYLKTAVISGAVVQTKGKGASGSFKLPAAKVQRASKTETKKATIEKKTATARKAAVAKKPAVAKKAAGSPKKQPAQKKTAAKPAGEKSKAAAETKSPSKAKKTAKAPAAKTKTPKPKKTTAKAVKSAAKK